VYDRLQPLIEQVIRVANADEYDAAIARVKNSPDRASQRDWELTRRAAQQAGSRGNRAREALGES